MSDTTAEQQPEHKEEIMATTGEDVVKPEGAKQESNGEVPQTDAAPETTKAETEETKKNQESVTPKPKSSLSMTITCKTIKAKFPSVTQLSTQDLQKWIDEPTSNIVLLDVRPEEEYNVSHLEGSHRVDPDTTDMEKVLEVINNLKLEGKDTQVVAYCSLGYRSSQLATRVLNHLKKTPPAEASEEKPALKISNLEGSLFKWANEDRQMVNNENEQVKLVHQYTKIWGKVLRKDLRFKPVKVAPPPKESKKDEKATGNGAASTDKNGEAASAEAPKAEDVVSNGASKDEASPAVVEEPKADSTPAIVAAAA
jgi:rhodanese-related sulfurtransferase